MIDPSVIQIIDEVRSEKSKLAWGLFGYENDRLQTRHTGEKGKWTDLISHFLDQEIMYGLAKVSVVSIQGDIIQQLQSPRFIFLIWVGCGVRGIKKAKALADRAAIKTLIGSFSLELYAEDLTDIGPKNVLATYLKATTFGVSDGLNLSLYCVSKNEMEQSEVSLRSLTLPQAIDYDDDDEDGDLSPKISSSSSSSSLMDDEEMSYSSSSQSSSPSVPPPPPPQSMSRSATPLLRAQWRKPTSQKPFPTLKSGTHKLPSTSNAETDCVVEGSFSLNIKGKRSASGGRERPRSADFRNESVEVSTAIAQRKQVINEIYETEKSYCRSLETCVRVYILPLRSSQIIPPEKREIIFKNMEEILYLNKCFLEKLESSFKNNNDVKVGELFIELTPKLKQYGEYISNCDLAIRTYKKLVSKSSKFSSFLQSCRQDPEIQKTKMDIPSYLIMPVQRIPRYELLVKDCLKKTPADHPDNSPLKEAAESLEQVGKYINDMSQAKTQRRESKKTQKDIITAPSALGQIGTAAVSSGVLKESFSETHKNCEKVISEKDKELKELRNKIIELEFKNQELQAVVDQQKKELDNFQKNFAKLSKKF